MTIDSNEKTTTSTKKRKWGEKRMKKKKKIFHNNYDQSHFPMLKVNSLKEREKQNSNVIDYG